MKAHFLSVFFSGQRMTSFNLTDITITAIDVYGHLLMAGTNMAVLYIIDRKKRCLLHKLKCGVS